jgi:hypothetical protein
MQVGVHLLALALMFVIREAWVLRVGVFTTQWVGLGAWKVFGPGPAWLRHLVLPAAALAAVSYVKSYRQPYDLTNEIIVADVTALAIAMLLAMVLRMGMGCQLVAAARISPTNARKFSLRELFLETIAVCVALGFVRSHHWTSGEIALPPAITVGSVLGIGIVTQLVCALSELGRMRKFATGMAGLFTIASCYFLGYATPAPDEFPFFLALIATGAVVQGMLSATTLRQAGFRLNLGIPRENGEERSPSSNFPRK